jgi:hypothetical protein
MAHSALARRLGFKFSFNEISFKYVNYVQFKFRHPAQELQPAQSP